MTLGERLSTYRKSSGMTQQELGEHLNISAQAVSKWENDLSEPDIATLKRLSELFKVSMVELLDIEQNDEGQLQESEPQATPPVMTEDEVNNITSKITDAVIGEINVTPKTLGFCVMCGIAVTEDNLGETTPKVLCSDCLEKRIEQEKKAIQAQRNKEESERRQEEYKRSRMRFKRNASIITGLAVGAIMLILCIIGFENKGMGAVAGIVVGYMSFAFTAQMFFDGVVRNLLIDMADKSIHFPGLIFSFDIDGIVWLICMKVLFAIIGFLGAILFAILGFIVALVAAPFVYPFSLIRQNKAIRECDTVEFE